MSGMWHTQIPLEQFKAVVDALSGRSVPIHSSRIVSLYITIILPIL